MACFGADISDRVVVTGNSIAAGVLHYGISFRLERVNMLALSLIFHQAIRHVEVVWLYY